MPTDEEDEVDNDDEGEDEDDAPDPAPSDGGDDAIEANGQRLVRVDRRRRIAAAPSDVTPPPARPPRPSPSAPGASPKTTAGRRPKKRRPTEPDAIQPVTNNAAPVALPPPPPAVPTVQSSAVEGNVFFAFEETVKLHPAAANTIAVVRKTGTPAHWMLATRPRTANELYAAILNLHGRSPETTYEVTFRDGAGNGSGGEVSMPSTVDQQVAAPAAGQPLPPQQFQGIYAQPQYAPPAGVAPAAQLAQPGTPFDAILAMQKQLFEMVNAMSPKQAPAAAAPPAPLPPSPPPGPDVNSILAMQKQMFDMMQALQAPASAPVSPPPPLQQPAPASPSSDPMAAVLAMQKQVFEMMQALQTGHAPLTPAQPAIAPTPAPAADTTGAMLAMQKQMFDMMLTMMQAAQRGSAPPGVGGPYRPRYGDPRDPRDPSDPSAPPYGQRPPYQPPPRPQTPTEQLQDAVRVVRSTVEIAREFADGFGGRAPEPGPPPPDEGDDSPVRVIDMGPAKGVINRSDGSLRGFETAMANMPKALSWIGEQFESVRKARAEARAEERRQQQQLPPGYVVATPDYVPPEGYVAVPVCRHGRPIVECPDERCRGGQDAPPQATTSPLPEPPAEMPPPIAQREPVRPVAEEPKPTSWGMPPGIPPKQ